MTKRHSGITLGPDSPLRDARVRRAALRRILPDEFEIQSALVAVLVGDARKGEQFVPGAGLTGRHPELLLLFAVPNGGARSRRAAGRAKAEGAHAAIPDLVLPVPRGPYTGLMVECKRPDEYPTARQREMHEALRSHGWLVCIVDAVDAGVRLFCEYLSLAAREATASDELTARLTPPRTPLSAAAQSLAT